MTFNSSGTLSIVTTNPQTVTTTAGAWLTVGNAGTTAGTNYIGTTDAVDVVMKRFNIEQLRLTSSGVVVNNNATSTLNFRVLSQGRANALLVDANENLTRFGTGSTTSDYDNGTSRNGVTVDYVADFDRGTTTGTATGIGSVEYMLDDDALTYISDDFAPLYDDYAACGTFLNSWYEVNTYNLTVWSDSTLKTNVRSLNYGLAELMQLKPVAYDLKKDHMGKTFIPVDQREHQLGFIAQEVLPVMKELVRTDGWEPAGEDQPGVFVKKKREKLGVNYIGMVPVIVRGMQEQQNMIEHNASETELLKKRVDEQQKLIEQLRRKLDEFEINK